MRDLLQAVLAGLLILIALAGFGIAIVLVYATTHETGHVESLGLLSALAIAAPAFLVGTIALAAYGIMVSIDIARDKQLAIATAELEVQREQLGIQQHIQARMIAAGIGSEK